MTFRQRAELALSHYRDVDPATNCWLWTGYRMRDGHGMVTICDEQYLVHRLSAMLYLGLVLERRPVGSRRDASQVNHKCPGAHTALEMVTP